MPKNLSDREIEKLFREYSRIMEKLRKLKVIRSNNNPVGDYGEYIAVKLLKLKQAGKSAKGFDAVDRKGKKYQIKTRRPTPQNDSRQLGSFRDLDKKLFHYCLAIILSPDFSLAEMWKIPRGMIRKYAQKTTRGYKRIILKGKILKEPSVKRLHP